MPEATNEADGELGDRLKSTLWYHVGQLVDEETVNLGMNASPQYIGSLTELVWTQIGNIATDLESFAKHAGRNTVRPEDVMLLARRNEGLHSILKQKAEELEKKSQQKARRQDG